jgi:hypothetical protein
MRRQRPMLLDHRGGEMKRMHGSRPHVQSRRLLMLVAALALAGDDNDD